VQLPNHAQRQMFRRAAQIAVCTSGTCTVSLQIIS
jgi:hypothetical protein